MPILTRDASLFMEEGISQFQDAKVSETPGTGRTILLSLLLTRRQVVPQHIDDLPFISDLGHVAVV